MGWPKNLENTPTIPTLNDPISNLYSNLNKRFGVTTAASTPNLTNPLAASVDPSVIGTANTSDKNRKYSVTAGQMIGLASDALGIYGNYLGTKGQIKSLKAQAQEYDTQRMLNYDSYRQNVKYMAEENLYNVAKIRSEYEDFEAAQSAAVGASGFDVSAGEQRIFRDTEVKAEDAKFLANRETYLQSFELWRSTQMENARLLAAAKSARSQAKYLKKMNKLNIISGALGAAANFIQLGSYGGTGDVDVRGVKKK